MSGVDDRIVSMKFDNAAFEQKLNATIKSLDELRKSLDFANATRGFENVTAAANSVNLGHIASATEEIASKFNAMTVIAVSALNQLTHAALNAGTKMVKAFAFAPIMDGFHEFETNMNSIQTIMANTSGQGTGLNDVNSALDTLNAYSDKTIYNFGQMARNIGTFTAAGVDLETATSSIKGIANIAAASGSSAEQASTAMYQLSQAIASGTVKLMDWNSVVNAGMGGQLFQNALFETGKALGTLRGIPMDQTFDAWKAAGHTFRDSLSDTGMAAGGAGDAIGKAHKDAAEQIAEAEENAAESIENAEERIADARLSSEKASKEAAKNIAEAEEDKADASEKAAEDIAKAEESQADVFERTAEAVKNAERDQQKTIEDSAKNIEDALQSVVDAQNRLKDAMKPASADDLSSATDRLTLSQLDQADLADAVTEAQQDQTRAAEDLAEARQVLTALEATGTASAQALADARRRVEDADARSADLADAVTRAEIRQRDAARSVTDAEERLQEVQNKGTNQDQEVIDAKDDLASAQQNLADVTAQAEEDQAAAALKVQEAETDSAERRQEAIEATAKAHEDAAERESDAADRLTEVTERAAERQADAAKAVAEAEKDAAKAREDAADSVAKAHESAADRINSAGASMGGAAPKSWLTSDVLTTTLSAFTGDLDEAQLKEMGYTEAQAKEMVRLGKLATNAAQDVKTLSQLVSTVKENVGSGWSKTFRTVIGDFEESKQLFTAINNSISEFINNQAAARDKVLQGWVAMGGRVKLIEAFQSVFHTLKDAMDQVATAFHDIFPPVTSETLFNLTTGFSNFADTLKELSDKYMPAIALGLKGIFAVAEIVWEVIKGVVGIFLDLAGLLGTLVAGPSLGIFGVLAEGAIKLNDILVENGGISDFFEKIGGYIKNATGYIQGFKEEVVGLFTGFSGHEEVEKATGKVTDSFNLLGGAADFVRDAWDRMTGRFSMIAGELNAVWDTISGFIKGIGQKLADLIKPGDFDTAVDAINVGLLGGILVMLKKFLDGGLKLDFSGGLFTSIKKSFDTLTGTLKSMQAQLKAKALEKIAIAIGILTASLVVLSLIDSEKLLKALLAMSVGFGELVGTMALMDKMSGMSPMKMNGMATAMILMATAIGILSMAVTNFSQLDAGELIKGLGGVAAAMVILVSAMNMMATGTPGMIKASIAMGAVGVALLILSKVVSTFSDMSLKEMGQGLLGVAAAMLIIAVGMKAIDTKATLGSGLAMLALALSLKHMAAAVEAFANIPWPEIAQGTASITVLLLALGAALRSMPSNLPALAVGLVLVSGALVVLSEAVKIMGGIKMGELVKGLVGIAAVMAILVISMNAMEGALAGAGALVIVSGALLVLSGVLKILGGMSLAEIGKALLAMAGAFLVLGIAGLALEPVVPAILALGTAMALVGGSFALFGAGAFFIAKAFEVMAESGAAGAKAFVAAGETMIGAIPKLLGALVKSLAEMAKNLISVVPMFIEVFRVILGKILDVVIELTPKIAKALQGIILSGLGLIKEVIPAVIETGFAIFKALLTGILSNIGGITVTVIEIFGKFASAVIDNMGSIVASAAGVILAFIEEIGKHAADFVTAGLELLVNLLLGISKNIGKVVAAVATIITTILGELIKAYSKIISAGLSLLEMLISGVIDNIGKVASMITEIITKIIDTLGESALDIIQAGLDLLLNFLSGLGDNLHKVTEVVSSIVTQFISDLGDLAEDVVTAGADALGDFLWGVLKTIPDIAEAITAIITEILYQIGLNVPKIVQAGFDMFIALFDGLAEVIRDKSGDLGKAMGNLVSALVEGIGDALKEAIKEIANDLFPGLGKVVDGILDFFGIASPSKMFHWIGEMLMTGFSDGIMKNMDKPANSVEAVGNNVVDIFKNSVKKIAESVDGIDEFQPVIRPVLDLTQVQAQARGLQGLVDVSPTITPEVSFARARTISTTAEMAREAAALEPTYTGPREVKFEQNNYSPEALSTNDIWRNTKSQIAMAKEELEIA